MKENGVPDRVYLKLLRGRKTSCNALLIVSSSPPVRLPSSSQHVSCLLLLPSARPAVAPEIPSYKIIKSGINFDVINSGRKESSLR